MNTLDFMHIPALNIPKLLFLLFWGKIDCEKTDSKNTWDWAVLQGKVWKSHGAEVADCTPYLPGSFDHPPCNPAEKISSGYKVWEFLIYIYSLGLALFYSVLPEKYWKNLCLLIQGCKLPLVENRALSTYMHLKGIQGTVNHVVHWARLALPNGQTAWSRWKELQSKEAQRVSCQVKSSICIHPKLEGHMYIAKKPGLDIARMAGFEDLDDSAGPQEGIPFYTLVHPERKCVVVSDPVGKQRGRQ
ncbi:Amidohydrolase family protein [Salix suchowensis]|nr:Amidohydrolase family protein [Salix suchowensis]